MSLYEMGDGLLKLNHSAGVFSCYTIRLEAILDYFNTFKCPPDVIDSSVQFSMFKDVWARDVSDGFYKWNDLQSIPEYDHPISSTSDDREQQFSDYNKLHFSDLQPFVRKFFAPSDWISTRLFQIEQQFPTLSDEFCGVLYRGTCKKLETIQPSHSEFIERVVQFKQKHPGIKFFIQTDEPCLFAMAERRLGHENCFLEPIQGASKLATVQNYVANVIAMSRCKHLITTSGNGEYWMRLFRGNNERCVQWLSQKEFIYGTWNKHFDPNQKNFWLENC